MKDRVQVWMSREEFQALKRFLEGTDEFDDRSDARPLLDLYASMVEAQINNSNHDLHPTVVIDRLSARAEGRPSSRE